MSDIPPWHYFMLPTLEVLKEGVVLHTRELASAAADQLGVSEEQRQEVLSNSGQKRFLNRAQWAQSYLSRAGALSRPKRGHYEITNEGHDLMARHPSGISQKALRELPKYIEAIEASSASRESTESATSSTGEAASPSELIDEALNELNADVSAELLSRLHGQEPSFFEQAVLDLLMAMGYGGVQGRATRTQLVGDAGLDGVIDQDALGLSRVYVQAKRYGINQTVGRPAIQEFVGALHGQQANQGVFITTAKFSAMARTYADSVQTRVVLIDGAKLASLMIRFEVGVQVERTVKIVEIDEDFFA